MIGSRLIGALGIAGVMALAACGSSTPSGSPASPAGSQGTATSVSAVDLRVKLDVLLGEHMLLTAKTTDAALGGRSDEYTAYAKELATNGTDIGDLVGAAFGDAAKNQFNTIWSGHIGFFVDYTTAVAKGDASGKAAAVANLSNQYVPQFSKLLAGATGLPQNAVASLTSDHVTMTEAVIDDQAAGNWTKAYPDLRMAYGHMQKIGDALATAIASKESAKFAGNPATKTADLRVALNQLLQEHLYLATMATDAALGGRTAEFGGAGAALNQNGTDLGSAIGSLYGTDAQNQFNTIWSAHNGFFVDYTKAVAAKDANAKQTAVNELTQQYVPQFASFLAGATGLPVASLTSLVTDHVMTTAAVVDAQAAGSWTDTAAKDRTAAQHMEMIADPLAQAIVAKLPDKF